jgi:hypothetical protein
VDICGGSVGHTKWGDVNPACYTYAVKLSQCVQVCSGSNSMGGFGGCLEKCGMGPPDCSHCEGAADPEMTTYCHEFCTRSQSCACIEKSRAGTSLDFTNCVDTCVYPCSTSLETEMLLGVDLPWRHTKCGAGVFFACGGGDGLQCQPIAPWECEGPVGLGTTKCYADDPWCSDKNWVCSMPTNQSVPLPAQVVRLPMEAGWAGLYYPPMPSNTSNATQVATAEEYRGVPRPYEPPPPKDDEDKPSLLARALSERLRPRLRRGGPRHRPGLGRS